MNNHAALSPSAAARWLACTASVHAAAALPTPSSSAAAAEGTAAHEMAALALGGRPPDNLPDDLAPYLEYVRDRREELGATLLIEQRVDPGIPGCWGTADAILLSPGSGVVEIVDLKYGKGVRVDAEENPQLRLYGLGALNLASSVMEVERVVMTIVQPRRGHFSSQTLTATDLLAWQSSILPTAAAAASGPPRATYAPSEDACRWCPASGLCAAQTASVLAADFGQDPALMTPEDLADALEAIRPVTAWAEAVKAQALRLAYMRREPIPRHKVVAGRSRRVVADADAAAAALARHGLDPDEYAPRSLLGITALERLLGKGAMSSLLEDSGAVITVVGHPQVVPETDGRPPLEDDTAPEVDFNPVM